MPRQLLRGGGGVCYAFEPVESVFKILSRTAELNPNIIPVKKGLSNETTSRTIFSKYCYTMSGSFLEEMNVEGKWKSSEQVETVTLDDFVKENGLNRVDFIKADIEGYERYMLMGAQETLKKFSPKLVLCTYHLPDDPEVLAKLIKQANPNYNIVFKHYKLFASVPDDKK